MVPERAAALLSCAPPLLPEPEQRSIAQADRIFWQEIRDEVDSPSPFRSTLPTSAHCYMRSAVLLPVLALLPCLAARRPRRPIPASRGFHRGIQETRCREQVTGSCHGFGVFAAADKSGWYRAMGTARRHGRPQVLSRFGRRASFSAAQGTHHGWSHPILRMSWARQHAR